MAEPICQMNAVDGIWIRMMTFKKGDIHAGHKHTYNHITLLSSGSLKVTVEGWPSEFKSPCMIFIHKDNNHQLEALEDNTVACCVHAVRDMATGDIVDGLKIPPNIALQPLVARR